MQGELVKVDELLLPKWLLKLALRIASLQAGNAYSVMVLLDNKGDAKCVVTPLGKIENLGKSSIDTARGE